MQGSDTIRHGVARKRLIKMSSIGNLIRKKPKIKVCLLTLDFSYLDHMSKESILQAKKLLTLVS